MYKLLCSTNKENVGIDLWYNKGKKNKPCIIFATGRHGQKNTISNPYILYKFNSNPINLYDNKFNIISGFFSGISIDRNLILFTGNTAKVIEHSRLYLISPKTNICKLIYTFIPNNNFSARTGLVKNKQVIIGGTLGTILIYNFDSKYKLINNKIINTSSIDNVIVGLHLYNNILSVGIRTKFSINEYAKSVIINLENNYINYFTTNMQCTGIYHDEKIIVCIGSGQAKLLSQCFYMPILENNKFGEKVNLALCDGRSCLVFDNNIFILCVSESHIYIKNFTDNNPIYHYIDNINPPCRGCVKYKNKIIISSIKGTSYILDINKII